MNETYTRLTVGPILVVMGLIGLKYWLKLAPTEVKMRFKLEGVVKGFLLVIAFIFCGAGMTIYSLWELLSESARH